MSGKVSMVLPVLLWLAGCAAPVPKPGEGLVKVPGGKVWYRITGTGTGTATPLLLLHGGPGAGSRGLERLAALGDERLVVFYDQLGCGRSERPHDRSLWTVERFVKEVAAVRKRLGLQRVHILGHSWGSMLAVDYLLTKPKGVESVILAGPALSIPRYLRDVQMMRNLLPPEVRDTLARHEAAGTTGSKEYQDASMVFYKRHLSRLDPWPPELSFEGFGEEVYNTMWGPSEFHATGPLKDYDRTSRLHELKLPVLFTAGRYDETTPEQAEWYRSLVPKARLEVFEKSAHMTMLDEADRYIAAVRKFLYEVEHPETGP